MAITTETTSAARRPSSTADQPPERELRWVLPVALALVLAPFVVAAVRMLTTRDAFWNAGDQAIIGLSVHEASHLHQFLGPYSRYGFSHPGPSWFYVLSPLYNLFGATGSALVAASIVVQGLLAAAVVALAHRWRRPALTLLVAGVVLLFILRMPSSFFVSVWNPFALILATAVFLLLAVRVGAGHWSDLVLFVIAGSYLVQTHVGTAPLVGAVGLVGAAAFVLARRGDRASETPTMDRRARIVTAVLGLVLVLMWVPPLYQQLAAPPHQGNLADLAHFFLHGGGGSVHPTTGQAFIATGRLLAMAPYGWGPGPWVMNVSTLSAAVAVGLVAQALASVALVVAGRRWKVRDATWFGVVTLVALLAAVVSARTVSGTLYWYLLTWITVLPAVTLLGLAVLVLGRRAPAQARAERGRWAERLRLATSQPVVIGLVVVVAVGAVVLALSLGRAVDDLPDSPGVRVASTATDAALRPYRPGDIKVDIETLPLWPIGAGLADELAADGWTVHVGPQSANLFGKARVRRAHERTELTVVASDDPRVPALVAAGVRNLGSVQTELGPATILLKAG